MNLTQMIKYGGQEIRIVEKDGAPWWVLADVCAAIDVAQATQAAERLDDDEKGVYTIHTLGGNQEVIIINEPGLYSLILTSRKPEAKAFKRWLTHEVLPAIRKKGCYISPERSRYNTAINKWAKRAKELPLIASEEEVVDFRRKLLESATEIIGCDD